MNTILFALWFFLPAGIANAVPILAAKLPLLAKVDTPLDLGAFYKKKRVLGPHKTWRGLISGIIAAIITIYIQQSLQQSYTFGFLQSSNADYLFYSPLLLGFLFGFGALAGDAIESFFKRQTNIAAGKAWFPYDQIDYIIGGCVAMLVVIRLELHEYATIILTWFLLHLLFSYIGYRLRLKSSPI